MDWEQLKKELKKLPLRERLVELQLLLKNVKDKKLKAAIEKEVKKVISQIEKKRGWKAGGSITFSGKGIEEVASKEVAEPVALDGIVSDLVEEQTEDKAAMKIDYGGAGDYMGGYLKGSYEQQQSEESSNANRRGGRNEAAAADYTRSPEEKESLLSEREQVMEELEEEKMSDYERRKKEDE